MDLFPHQQISLLQERPQSQDTDKDIPLSMTIKKLGMEVRYLLCDESATTRYIFSDAYCTRNNRRLLWITAAEAPHPAEAVAGSFRPRSR